MSTQNAVVALIHDRLGTALKDFFQLGQDAPVPEKLVILIAQEQSLLEQLQEVETTDDEKKAPNITSNTRHGELSGVELSSLKRLTLRTKAPAPSMPNLPLAGHQPSCHPLMRVHPIRLLS